MCPRMLTLTSLPAPKPMASPTRFATELARDMRFSSGGNLRPSATTPIVNRFPQLSRRAMYGHTFFMLKRISRMRMTCAPPGNTRCQRNPAGIAAHQFDQHHAMMCLGGGVQLVDTIGSGMHGGVESKRDLGGGKIV